MFKNLERERRLLTAHLLGWTYEEVFLKNPKPDSVEGFNALWQKRLAGTPLARLMGKQMFRDLEFHISPHVLEPRSDSELILDVLHQLLPSSRGSQTLGDPEFPLDCRVSHDARSDGSGRMHCLDLGVGSGCLLISILKEWPEATGVGVDISKDALDVATQNGERHGINNRVAWIQSDWLTHVPLQQFDVIVANPPYIGLHEPLDDDVHLHDPHLALYGGQDGLDCYRAILANLRPYCHERTLCLFEIGHKQREAITSLLSGWHIHDIHLDESDHPRVVVFSLML